MAVKIKANIVKNGKEIAGYIVLKDDVVLESVYDLLETENWDKLVDVEGNEIKYQDIPYVDAEGFMVFEDAGVDVEIE